MADIFCKFFDARPITGFSFFVPYYYTQKPFLSLPLVSINNPTPIARKRRRRSRPLHIALCSPNFDVISTHEHADGTLLFRFGDPSEIAKEDELEEPNLRVEEVETNGEEEFSVVKVMDGDIEREVIVKKKERAVRGEPVALVTDSAVSELVVTNSERSNVVESETESSEKLVEDSADDDADVSHSPARIRDQSVSEVDIENAGHVEEILEKKDDGEVSISPPENGSPQLEVQAEMKDQSSEKSLEELDDGESPLLGSVLMPEYSSSVTTKEIEEAEGEGSKAVNSNSEIVRQIEQISENADPIMEDPEESVYEENNLGNAETVDEVSSENADIRHLSIEAEDKSSQVVNFEDDGQNELINLSTYTEDQTSQNGTVKDSGEVIEVMPLSPALEAEPILDEEVDHNLIAESKKAENPLLPDENLPYISLERIGDVEKCDIMEVPGHELVEDKSSGAVISISASNVNSKEAPPTELILSSGATFLPHPSKVLTGGEDACFVAHEKWLGLADGVGCWSLEGSDPGVYAHELVQNSETIVCQCDEDLINDPKTVLSLSVAKTDSPGSSTVLIAHFDGQALHVANIGDSGFLIVRNGSVYRRSSPMLHEFNFSVQIGKGDDPCQLLEEYKIELDEGDIIVSATDGLFDNLYEQEIVSIVSKSLESDKRPQEIAEILATRAQQVGSSAYARSPFADAAQAAGYVGYTGGKLDDVAVIVSVVQKVITLNAN